MNKAGHEEEVAIKKIEDRASEEDKIHFLQEAAILGQFSHPNIVSIVGVVINTYRGMVSYKIIIFTSKTSLYIIHHC